MFRGNRVSVVVQARMGSSRLPGKVLMPLAGKPELWHVKERLKRLSFVDEIVVATSDLAGDDEVAAFVEAQNDEGVRLFRGDHEDVLSRFYHALVEDPPDLVVRVTGDTPLVSVEHIETMVRYLVENDLDGVDAHTHTTGLTLGFGSEVYRFEALVAAYHNAREPEEREHVSLYIKRRPERFAVAYPKPAPQLCSDYRFTLDYERDYELLSAVFDALYEPGEIIRCRAAIALLDERPELVGINAECLQNTP